MKEIDIFHKLSHAKWIFFIWAIFLLIQAFVNPRLYALTNTGLAVFIFGLYFGFRGFSDTEKLSKAEKKNFANPKLVKTGNIIILVLAGYFFIAGILFMNIRFLRPGMKEIIVSELKTIGYHCFALGFGLLCYLKFLFDKHKYFQSLPKDKQN